MRIYRNFSFRISISEENDIRERGYVGWIHTIQNIFLQIPECDKETLYFLSAELCRHCFTSTVMMRSPGQRFVRPGRLVQGGNGKRGGSATET